MSRPLHSGLGHQPSAELYAEVLGDGGATTQRHVAPEHVTRYCGIVYQLICSYIQVGVIETGSIIFAALNLYYTLEINAKEWGKV